MFGTIVEIGRIIKPMHSYRVNNFPPAFQPAIPRNIITEVRELRTIAATALLDFLLHQFKQIPYRLKKLFSKYYE